MDDNNRKGQFGVAYVSALAAAAGYMTYTPGPDLESVDLGIAARAEDIEGAPSIELQIKTHSHVLNTPELSFQLRKKNYNDLRRKVLTPRYLVVVTVPRAEEPWLAEAEGSLTLYYGAYYLDLKGADELKGESKVVKLPRTQLLTMQSLKALLTRASAQVLFR